MCTLPIQTYDQGLWLLKKQINRDYMYNIKRINNDKADSYPQHVGKFFNFRIFIEFFIYEVKETLKFWVSGPKMYNKYQ